MHRKMVVARTQTNIEYSEKKDKKLCRQKLEQMAFKEEIMMINCIYIAFYHFKTAFLLSYLFSKRAIKQKMYLLSHLVKEWIPEA